LIAGAFVTALVLVAASKDDLSTLPGVPAGI